MAVLKKLNVHGLIWLGIGVLFSLFGNHMAVLFFSSWITAVVMELCYYTIIIEEMWNSLEAVVIILFGMEIKV